MSEVHSDSFDGDEAAFESVSRWIEAVSRGAEPTSDELWLEVYEQLRRMARRRMGGAQLAGETLQPTALVHEAFVRLGLRDGPSGRAWDNRHHLVFAAARAMHDVLVERARARAALKRGGDRRRLDLDAVRIAHETPPEEMLALHDALQALEREDPRRHRIVMLRFFAGLEASAVAQLLDVSLRTVEREWRLARIGLYAALHDDAVEDGQS